MELPELLCLSSDENGPLRVSVKFSNYQGRIYPIHMRAEDLMKLVQNGTFVKEMRMDDYPCIIDKLEISPARCSLVIKARVKGVSEKPKKLYRRGTAVVIRNGRLLLVRERGKKAFSLPGGRARSNEPALAAAVRELQEELGMTAIKAERLFDCDYMGKAAHHKVVLIETNDAPSPCPTEIAEVTWWRPGQALPMLAHASSIAKMLAEKGFL